MSNDKNRTKTRVAIYLVGVKNNNEVLLGKRINTNHMNNHWSLPAGHVYEGESCTSAFLREAKEEIGLEINSNDFILAGAMHQFSDPYDYINYIYLANLEKYTPQNTEPKKCAELRFFNIDKLPDPMEQYIKFIIETALKNKNPWILEYGFNS